MANHHDALNLEILELASSSLLKRQKAWKASLIVFLAAVSYVYCQVRNVKTTCTKSWPENLLQGLNFPFDPCFKLKWGHLNTKSLYISLSTPLLQSLRREITTAAVVLFSCDLTPILQKSV